MFMYHVARHILLGFYFTLPFWKQNVSKSLSESNNSQKQQFLISCSFICGFQRFSTSHVGLSGGIHISQWRGQETYITTPNFTLIIGKHHNEEKNKHIWSYFNPFLLFLSYFSKPRFLIFNYTFCVILFLILRNKKKKIIPSKNMFSKQNVLIVIGMVSKELTRKSSNCFQI